MRSFRHLDAVLDAAARCGWQTVPARRGADIERRFIASGAAVALIDARGALEEGLAEARSIGDAVEANGGALIVLISRDSIGALDAVFAAGATHYLASPFGDAELAQALRFAARHAERLGAGISVPDAAWAGRPGGGGDRRNRDALTGLADGAAIRRWIDKSIAAEGDAPRVMLILLAVSRFDAINAAFGAATGDRVLQGVARRIERQLANSAIPHCIGRVAGAEFAVALASPTTPAEAMMVARGLAAAIDRPFATDDLIISLASRVAIAMPARDDENAATLMRRASAALAEAKADEPGTVRLLDAAGEAQAARADRLEVDLRVALDRGEIGILFQPQVSITTGAIVGVEALARWQHPALGELGAVTLFSAAERSDYLLQLSEHVQAKAIALAAAWPDTLSALRLSVNVTASDIARPGFAARFLGMVDASGFPRARVTVEVTESGLIEDLAQAAALLGELRSGGLRVAIDDFGTGYSSLAYLKALPIDYLKIDQKLAQDIAGSARDRVVVRGVIEMARSLGLAVIAEGVETEEQLALLAAEGCNLYQGFLCAPPVDTARLLALVAAAG